MAELTVTWHCSSVCVCVFVVCVLGCCGWGWQRMLLWLSDIAVQCLREGPTWVVFLSPHWQLANNPASRRFNVGSKLYLGQAYITRPQCRFHFCAWAECVFAIVLLLVSICAVAVCSLRQIRKYIVQGNKFSLLCWLHWSPLNTWPTRGSDTFLTPIYRGMLLFIVIIYNISADSHITHLMIL